MPNWTKARSEHAVLSRAKGRDHPDTLAKRAELRALRTEEYIEKTLAERPPLTNEQRIRLAELLRPVRADGGTR